MSKPTYKYTLKYAGANDLVFDHILPITFEVLANLPRVASEAEGPQPWLAMVQNEDQVDYWLVDPENIVEGTENIRRYYWDQAPWVIEHARFIIRLFSLTQQIVY